MFTRRQSLTLLSSTALTASLAAGDALAQAGGPYRATRDSVDPLLAEPYVDLDEWRDKPVRHRHVHGGFRGTAARFVIRFPPAERYGGRFFQYNSPVPIAEDQNGAIFGGIDEFIDFCVESGGAAVVSNQGGPAATASPDVATDPTIAAYRVSAATAKFTRTLAAQMYGPHRTYGYAFGGSGGAFRTFGCAENTDVWDGVVPFIHGSAGSSPNNYAARVRVLRVLKNKLPKIADALEPGGGDVYTHLSAEEAAVLREATGIGFPLRTWIFHETMGIGAFAVLFRSIQSVDPTYFEDFWKVPGYEGANPPPSLSAARIQHRTRITQIIMSDKAVEAGLGSPPSLGRASAAPDLAWRQFQTDNGGRPLAIALELETAPPPGDLTQAGLFAVSGDAAGSRLDLAAMKGRIALLQFGPASGSLREITERLRVGDEIRVDNSNFLAVQTYYRHQVLPRSYRVYDSLRAPDGAPLYPQRPKLQGLGFVRSAMGSDQTGKFSGKMIVVQSLFDWDAAAWHADWYRSLVRTNYGPDFQDRYRLYYVDRGTHGVVPDPRKAVNYQPALQQALRDLSAWVERGIAPPQETSYRLAGGQIELASSAAARKGLQAVIALTANGAERADIRAGDEVRFSATVEMPPQSGQIVSAEWDFEAGTTAYPFSEKVSPASRVRLSRTFRFERPGTYFPTLRVHSHRDGDPQAKHAKIPNLARVRVVVS
uniref:PKD domain-containing protein n=1 Tax=uncultured bacterium 5H7 TaxID=1701327 RepID=A0A0N9HHE7_9BACT|nr:hypothetical protein 5H7_054 [uncultured bacterium 5H7]